MTKEHNEYLKKIDTSYLKKSEQLFNNSYCNFGHCKMLGLLFITLKLTGVVQWSWWVVLSPYVASILISTIAAYSIVYAFAIMAKIDVMNKDANSSKPQIINE